jgi:hypothetical protein
MHCLSIPLLHVFREFRPAYKIRAGLFYYISLFAPRPPVTKPYGKPGLLYLAN